MLNKTPKQHTSFWKFGTVVPLLLAFMFFFNLKTEAQVTSSDAKTTETSVDSSPNVAGENNFQAVPDAQDINASQSQAISGYGYYSVQEENPIVVLNGKVMEKDFKVKSIDPDDIATVNVLKGDSAAEIYGSEASKHGVVEIVTKAFANDDEKQVDHTSESEHITVIRKGENGGTVDIRGVSNEVGPKVRPLYVMNGKMMKTDFDVNSIDVNNIESVNVLKNASATTKYGRKAEGGVIEIKTKE